jgi:hypothetical protein
VYLSLPMAQLYNWGPGACVYRTRLSLNSKGVYMDMRFGLFPQRLSQTQLAHSTMPLRLPRFIVRQLSKPNKVTSTPGLLPDSATLNDVANYPPPKSLTRTVEKPSVAPCSTELCFPCHPSIVCDHTVCRSLRLRLVDRKFGRDCNSKMVRQPYLRARAIVEMSGQVDGILTGSRSQIRHS